MSQQSERVEATFNRHIVPALEDFTSRNPIPQPLLESLRNRPANYSLIRAIFETIEGESQGFVDSLGIRGRTDPLAVLVTDLVQTWYPYAPRLAYVAELVSLGGKEAESLRGMALVGFDIPGSNRPGSLSVIHDKFADLMREDPRGFEVIDFVTSSPEASRGRRNFAYSSNINHIITLGGKRFKRFYTGLDESQVQGAIS